MLRAGIDPPNCIEIIESLPATHLQTGTRLEETIKESARKRKIDVHCTQVANAVDFETFMRDLARECEQGRRPILHIESHGLESGIEFAIGPPLPWEDLKPLLQLVNAGTRLNLVVFVAACWGALSVKTMASMDVAPAILFVGPHDKISEKSLLEGTSDFYQLLLDTADMNMAIRGLVISERMDFAVYSAEMLVRQVLKDVDKERNLPARKLVFQQRIQRRLRKEGHSPSAAKKIAQLPTTSAEESAKIKIWERYFMIDRFPENANRFGSKP